MVALLALLSLAPAAAAFVKVATSLELGVTAPWHLLLLLVDGQFGFLMAFLWCGLIGGADRLRRRRRRQAERDRRHHGRAGAERPRAVGLRRPGLARRHAVDARPQLNRARKPLRRKLRA